MSDFVNKAEPYIATGWKVFPLRVQRHKDDGLYFAKDPEFGEQGGFYWGTDDPERIARYQEKFGPDCNIGLRTGRQSGVVVVDVDFGKPTVDPNIALQHLQSLGKIFPKTPVIAQTPSGGQHWYYRHAGPLKSSAGLVGKQGTQPSGIDIRADGGLAVLPPTSRYDGQYVWLAEPFAQTLPPVPRWLMEDYKPEPPRRTYRSQYDLPKGGDLDRIAHRLGYVRDALQGERNQTLFRQYAQCLDWGHPPSQIRPYFEQAALDAGLPQYRITPTCDQAERESNRRDPKRFRRRA